MKVCYISSCYSVRFHFHTLIYSVDLEFLRDTLHIVTLLFKYKKQICEAKILFYMKVDQVKTLFCSLESVIIRLVSLMVCQKIFQNLATLVYWDLHNPCDEIQWDYFFVSCFNQRQTASLYVHIFNELNKSHPSTIVTELEYSVLVIEKGLLWGSNYFSYC